MQLVRVEARGVDPAHQAKHVKRSNKVYPNCCGYRERVEVESVEFVVSLCLVRDGGAESARRARRTRSICSAGSARKAVIRDRRRCRLEGRACQVHCQDEGEEAGLDEGRPCGEVGQPDREMAHDAEHGHVQERGRKSEQQAAAREHCNENCARDLYLIRCSAVC